MNSQSLFTLFGPYISQNSKRKLIMFKNNFNYGMLEVFFL